LKRVLTGTTQAPQARIPSAETIQRAEFGAHSATRSPGSIPSDTSPRAVESISAATASKVISTAPSMIATEDPNLSAEESAISGIDVKSKWRGTIAW
jgi:hypothetical protein